MLNRMLTNGRVQRLSRLLNEPVPHVIGHLEFLLKNAYEHVPRSGRLGPDDLLAIEAWASWEGEEGVFLAQLLQSSLIVQNKRGHFFGNFWQEAPAYVQNRWRRKDLRQNSNPPLTHHRCVTDVPTGGLRGAQSRAEQSRAAKSRADKSRADKRREEERGKDVVGPEKTDCASGLPAVCSEQAAKLVQLLAEKPEVAPLILLVGSGMDGAVARNLSSAHTPQRIRQAVIYAARKSKRNPAGLIRKALENPNWKLA